MKACQLSSVWKILEKELFYSLSRLILHWIKLENFVMQLNRQSVQAWQNEKHYSKRNNTSENPINLVSRVSVAFPQKASWQADNPGKRRPDLGIFSAILSGTNWGFTPSQVRQESPCRFSWGVAVTSQRKTWVWEWLDGRVKRCSELKSWFCFGRGVMESKKIWNDKVIPCSKELFVLRNFQIKRPKTAINWAQLQINMGLWIPWHLKSMETLLRFMLLFMLLRAILVFWGYVGRLGLGPLCANNQTSLFFNW